MLKEVGEHFLLFKSSQFLVQRLRLPSKVGRLLGIRDSAAAKPWSMAD